MFLSSHDIGNGLKISKTLNKINPKIRLKNVIGMNRLTPTDVLDIVKELI